MAHFAKLDENNIVVQVEAVHNDVITDENGVEQESLGQNFLRSIHGDNATYVKTSYNTHMGIYWDDHSNNVEGDQSKAFRKNYAGLGFTYDPVNDAFIGPKQYNSWVLNTTTCSWEAPTPMPATDPSDTFDWGWNEDTLSWEKINYDQSNFQL